METNNEIIGNINDRISLVGQKIKTHQQPGPKKQKVIEVIFESCKQQPIECQVSYVVKNASWAPVYKTDIPADLAGLELAMFAIISQKTGEAWNNVDLSVSNALPMENTDLPEAKSWYVNVPSPMYNVAAGAAVPIGGTMDDAVPVTVEEFEETFEQPSAGFREAKEKKLPLAFEYGFDRKIDLSSGEDDTFLPIFSKKLSGRFFIYAVPDSDTASYMVCKTIPDQTLLASRLNIHYDGRFIGTTNLSEQKAGKDLLINLGPNRGVTIRKEKNKDKTTETFFGKVDRSTIARQFSYSIIVENHGNNHQDCPPKRY